MHDVVGRLEAEPVHAGHADRVAGRVEDAPAAGMPVPGSGGEGRGARENTGGGRAQRYGGRRDRRSGEQLPATE
jgi:hypothetical protein